MERNQTSWIGLALAVVGFMGTAALLPFLPAFQCRADTYETGDGTVSVQFGGGTTQLETLAVGANLLGNEDTPLVDFPHEIDGLSYTQRNANTATSITLDIPAGATLYMMLGNGNGTAKLRKDAESSGWKKLGNAHFTNKGKSATLAVFRQHPDQDKHIELDGKGSWGVILVGARLALDDSSNPSPDDQTPSDELSGKPGHRKSSGASARLDNTVAETVAPITRTQASIASLYATINDSGQEFGVMSSLILTATPGTSRNSIPIQFTTPVGQDMRIVLDEVARAISF